MAEKPSFLVQIHFQQKSTWQGTITWTERGHTQNFRSMLELIKLMDSAVKESMGEGEAPTWESGGSGE